MTRRRRGRSQRRPSKKSTRKRSGANPPRPPFPKDPRATFRLSKDFDSDVLKEEIQILTRLSEALTERLGPDAAPAERVDAAKEIWAEDPELSALSDRLDELMRTNPKSIARRMSDLGIEEAEEEGRL